MNAEETFWNDGPRGSSYADALELACAPAFVCEALLIYLPPEAGAALLLDQLLAAFTERALGAGKVTLLKRLAPIVSDAVGAGNSYPKHKPLR